MPDITVQDAIRAEAKKAGIPEAFALAVAEQESGFNPGAKSPKGALGVMQLMPDTAKKYGVDPAKPIENIRGGVQHLRYLLDKYQGDPSKVLAAYNGGEGVVGNTLPAETAAYVPAVLRRMSTFTTTPSPQRQTIAQRGTLGDPKKKASIGPPESLTSQFVRTIKASMPFLAGSAGAMAGAEAGGTMGATLGPLGAAVGAGTGALVGAGSGGILGAYVTHLANQFQGKAPDDNVLGTLGAEATNQMELEAGGRLIAAPLGFLRRGGFLKYSAETMKALGEDTKAGTRLSGPELASGTDIGEITKNLQSYSGGAFVGGRIQAAARAKGNQAALKIVDDSLALLGHPGTAGGPTATTKGSAYAAREFFGKVIEQELDKAPPIDVTQVKAAAAKELEQGIVQHLKAVPDVANPGLAKMIRAVRADPSLIARLPRPAVTRLADLVLEKYKSPTLQILRRVVGLEDQTAAKGLHAELGSLGAMSRPVDELYSKSDAQRTATFFRGQLREALGAAAPELSQALTQYRDLVRGDTLREQIVLGGKAVPTTEDGFNDMLTGMAGRLRTAVASGQIAREFNDPAGQQVVANLSTVANLLEKRTKPMAGNLRKIFELGRLLTIPVGLMMGRPTASMAIQATLWEAGPDFFTWVIHDPKATRWFIQGVSAENPNISSAATVRLMELYRQTHQAPTASKKAAPQPVTAPAGTEVAVTQ